MSSFQKRREDMRRIRFSESFSKLSFELRLMRQVQRLPRSELDSWRAGAGTTRFKSRIASAISLWRSAYWPGPWSNFCLTGVSPQSVDGSKHLLWSTDSAVVALARAELAFRRAEHSRAEALAGQAAARFTRSEALLPRALTRAGQSALLASREREGLNYLRRARVMAKSSSDVREAVIGLYSAASELGLPEAEDYLADLEGLDDGSAETALRIGVARLTQATREGAIGEAINQARVTKHMVEHASDPLASTSFLHMLANALNLAAAYDEAAETINVLLAIAKTYRVEMPVPHALLNRALAQHGQRSFAAAHRSLDEVARFVPPQGDVYLDFSSSAIRGRLLLSECRHAEAGRALQRPARFISSLSLRAEYLASQALAYACNGDRERSVELVEEANRIFPNSIESRVLGLSTLAIVQEMSPTASGMPRDRCGTRLLQLETMTALFADIGAIRPY